MNSEGGSSYSEVHKRSHSASLVRDVRDMSGNISITVSQSKEAFNSVSFRPQTHSSSMVRSKSVGESLSDRDSDDEQFSSSDEHQNIKHSSVIVPFSSAHNKMRQKDNKTTHTGATVAATMLKARNKSNKRPFKKRDFVVPSGSLTPIPIGGNKTPDQIRNKR